ncbi:hypothetical protein B9G55_18580 [Saccharibacillus sp. O16]|nr:hypothetical protein B9G55_18580 [Saccharibacillus sp. O16]
MKGFPGATSNRLLQKLKLRYAKNPQPLPKMLITNVFIALYSRRTFTNQSAFCYSRRRICLYCLYCKGAAFMTEYRLMQPHELEEAAALADSVFRGDRKPSMSDMFPRLFAPRMTHSYGAFTEDGSLGAFMGLAPSTLRVENKARIRAFSVGSVCTAPEQRGAGLAGQLLKRCIAHARAAEAPLIFVSGDRSLYLRAGCTPFGRTANVILRGLGAEPQAASTFQAAMQDSLAFRSALYAPAPPPTLVMRDAGIKDLMRLHELHASGSTIFEEGAAGLSDLLAAAAYCGVLGLEQRIILASIEGKSVAYAVFGVPPQPPTGATDEADPQASDSGSASSHPPTVIAYGGAPHHAADLLSCIATNEGLNELHVPVPWQDEKLLSLLQLHAAGVSSSFASNAGTVLILDPETLLNQAQPLWSRPWQEALQTDGRGNLFAAPTERQIERSEWAALLFDPQYPRPDDIPGWLTPIPLPYLYGLDYI